MLSDLAGLKSASVGKTSSEGVSYYESVIVSVATTAIYPPDGVTVAFLGLIVC